jgi:hypothetical protein
MDHFGWDGGFKVRTFRVQGVTLLEIFNLENFDFTFETSILFLEISLFFSGIFYSISGGFSFILETSIHL